MKHKLVLNTLKTSIHNLPWLNKSGSNLKDNFNPNIFIIRHAESKFNLALRNHEKLNNQMDQNEYQIKKLKIRFNYDLCDCEITETGKDQCYEAGQILKPSKLKFVFVSPMKRCLMTFQYVLNSINLNNPNPIKPEVIVHPMLFEKVEDSCDLIGNIHDNMKEFSHFNWELFNKIEHLPIYQLKYLDNYVGDNNNLTYHQRALDNFNKYKTYHHHNLLIKDMEVISKEHKSIESSKKTIERLETLKTYLNSFLDLNNKNEDVLLVGHSVLFKHLTSKYLNEHDYVPGPGEKTLKNCEITGLSFY